MGVCRKPPADTNELHFISEYISACLQTSLYNTVPWILAVAVVVSILCVLLHWQEYHESVHLQALYIHALVFHFCLNFACVVEFRTDSTTLSKAISSLKFNEGSLHQIAAVQAIVDFILIHLVISSNSCAEAGNTEHVDYEMVFYRGFENVYEVCTYIFLVCWVVHAMLPAAIFEWVLVLCAIGMQWVGIRRHALVCPNDMRQSQFHMFTERHSLMLLLFYILLNLVVVIYCAPPDFRLWGDATGEGNLVHTGPQFWCIVLAAAFTISLSDSASTTPGAWVFGACLILLFLLVYALPTLAF